MACVTSNSRFFDMDPECKCLVTFMAFIVCQWYQDPESKAAKRNSAIVNYNEYLCLPVKMFAKMSFKCVVLDKSICQTNKWEFPLWYMMEFQTHKEKQNKTRVRLSELWKWRRRAALFPIWPSGNLWYWK